MGQWEVSAPRLVVASLLDVREDPGTPARTLQVFNTALNALTAVGLGLAAISGIGNVLPSSGARVDAGRGRGGCVVPARLERGEQHSGNDEPTKPEEAATGRVRDCVEGGLPDGGWQQGDRLRPGRVYGRPPTGGPATSRSPGFS
ncbi:hypothetical protein AB0J27_06655 [Micromonospora chokoriensis]